MGRTSLAIRRFLADRRGGIALVAGLAAPVLVVATGATIEYGSLALRHTQLQKAADIAATAATQQLRLSNTSDTVVASVARAAFDAATPPKEGNARTITSTVLDKRSSVQVSAIEDVQSVLGRVMTLPSSQLSVTATAKISGSAKLCLLTLDPDRSKATELEAGSVITANGCGLFSNSTDKKGLSVGSGAQATAAVICSGGGIEDNGGYLSPLPTTDCPTISDPLAGVPRPQVGFCSDFQLPLLISLVSRTLYPGTYCNGITVQGGARVTLMPGIYVINNGPLLVQDTATLSGQNVGIYFTGNAGGMRLDPSTTINLTAPKDGVMAGLLFFEDRSVNNPILPPAGPKGPTKPPPVGSVPMRQYRITSNNAPNLLGTIYLPAGRLVIDASKPVAAKSAYTVVVVRQLDLNSGPNLFLNSDYAGTDVPVPDGVGPKTGNVALTR